MTTLTTGLRPTLSRLQIPALFMVQPVEIKANPSELNRHLTNCWFLWVGIALVSGFLRNLVLLSLLILLCPSPSRGFYDSSMIPNHLSPEPEICCTVWSLNTSPHVAFCSQRATPTSRKQKHQQRRLRGWPSVGCGREAGEPSEQKFWGGLDSIGWVGFLYFGRGGG